MEKRVFERMPTNIEAKFFCGNTMHTGTVTNISENGMFINTRMCLPFDSQFQILLPLKGDVLKVPVRVSRMVKVNDFYEGMGLSLVGGNSGYRDFVTKLRTGIFK